MDEQVLTASGASIVFGHRDVILSGPVHPTGVGMGKRCVVSYPFFRMITIARHCRRASGHFATASQKSLDQPGMRSMSRAHSGRSARKGAWPLG